MGGAQPLAITMNEGVCLAAEMEEWRIDKRIETRYLDEKYFDIDEAIDAAEIAKVLRSNGVVDVDPYRKLGRNQLRVATFTSTDQADIQALIACIDYVVAELGS
jgi:phosphoserine aminotransferase